MLYLKGLSISGSDKITDAGLLSLAKLANLGSLKIKGCKNATKDGIEEFRKLMPKVDLYKE